MAYGHFCNFKKSPWGTYYEVGWYSDTTHKRIRYPKQISREVEKIAAEKFCKKWNIKFPEAKNE